MNCNKKEILQMLIEQMEVQIQQAKRDWCLAKESRDSDTKSSAGDKYETGREMMQREMDKLGASVDTYQQQLLKLNALNALKSTNFVTHGSLIETNFETYYMAIGMGQMLIASETIYVISPESPLGALLMGKRVGDMIELRGRQINIKHVT